MTDSIAQFEPKWLSVPGDTMLDLLEEQGWSQTEFAERTGYTTKHISQLIRGKAPISEDTAFRLERVLGGSAAFWLAREAKYREAIAREEELEDLAHHVDWLHELPVKHLTDYNWVEQCSDRARQVSECLKFFGVASVDSWRARYIDAINAAAFKSSSQFEKKLGAVAAWIRQGERVAATRDCQSFDKRGFKKSIQTLRALTNETDPDLFVPQLIQTCAEFGVAVVLEPAPKGCPAWGATKWLAPDKALLMLSLRYKTNDHLWFAFFHEAAHIFLHSKKMLFVELKGPMTDEHEAEANEFAGDLLVPREKAEILPFLQHTEAAVREFSDHIGVAPGIVVGRMQHDGHLPRNFLNKLKVRYTWKIDC
jgi:HTH-type transcriptional regulator / antitoxin HigA